MSSERAHHEPACMVAHHLISRLAVIVGRCDLLDEATKNSAGSAKHIAAIREIAQTAIEELVDHQRALETEKRKAG
jgi:hypothetical protein